MVQVRILGPVRVADAGVEVPLTPQLRRLLSLLVVADGGHVSADRIAEHLADGDSDGSKIRTAVSRLRKVLGDRIETITGGYRLRVTEDELDAARFESLRRDARSAPASERIRLIDEALGLWHGDAFEGLSDLDWVAPTAARLETARTALTEDLAEALIEVDRLGEAIEVLESHLLAHAYRERPVGLLMRALAGTGRLPDALRTFQRFRVTLRDDLGLDPSSELRELEAELLATADGEPMQRDAGHSRTRSGSGSFGDLPPGATVTLLFTDIEASTRRWREDPVEMATALAEHDRTLQRIVCAHGGHIFKHTGDGVGAVFWSAAQALDAARQAQAALELPVRMGLHTGEVIQRDGDLYGPTVNRCARIADAGHGGQILLSAPTLGMIDGAVVDGTVDELGEHTLRGLASPERIFQFGHDRFPPLRVDYQPSALPTMLTALVGRGELVAAVEAEMRNGRLVTLLGPGGVGKTSVALAAAERLAEHFELALFVALDDVSDEADVLAALSQALRLPSPTLDSVVMALSARRSLIVVDNCEHVVEAAAQMVEQLLMASPDCRILATSREALGIAGEHIVDVPGLDASDVRSPAVELFRERVRSRDASVAFSPDDLEVVRDICEHVDGLPLAIELGAARIPMLSLSELRDRLAARFDVLTSGRRRSTGDRHRTLRATVDWSYELLDQDERDAFGRLSVFVGSFDLQGAVAVLDGRAETGVLDLLAALVDKSLLTHENLEGIRRYRFLETIHSYAEARLEATGELDAPMQALHVHHVRTVRSLVDDVRTRSMKTAGDRLNLEIPNVRRSFEHALDAGNVLAAAELIAPMAEVWNVVEWPINGWAAEALELPGADAAECFSHLLVLHAIDRLRNGELSGNRKLVRRALDEGGGYEQLPAWLCRPMANLLAVTGNEHLAVEWTKARLQAPAGFDATRALHLTLVMHSHEAFAGSGDGFVEDWKRRIEQARRHPSELVRAEAHWGATILAQLQGDFEAMLAESRELLDMRIVGSSDWLNALQLVAWAEHQMGHLQAAIRLTDELIDLSYRYADRISAHGGPMLHAITLRSLGEAEAAGMIRGRFASNPSGFPLARSLVELDPWLDAELGPDRVRELRFRARTLTPRELQTIAHEAERRHLDLA